MLPVTSAPPPSKVKKPTRRLRIGMVLDQPFPPDPRVEREATALVENGYEVHILCVRQPSDRLGELAYRGIYVHRLNPGNVSWQIPVLGQETRFPYKGVFRNMVWRFRNIDTVWHTLISRYVKHYGLDVLHIHDLRLLHTGLAIGEQLKLPVVADLHENYPALMEMMKGCHDLERGQQQRERWDLLESQGVERAARVLVVTEEARDRLIEKGLPGHKIHVVANTVDVDKFLAAPLDSDIIRRYKPDFMLCYVGHLNDVHRGIQTVLEALALLKDDIPELRFVGAGALRPSYRQLLETLIAEHALQDKVVLTDHIEESQFASYIEASDICLCPHLANDQTNATFPNKVYLYHLLKKPVLASNATPLKRYVDATEGGMLFESGNAADLAEKIRLLYDRPDLRKEMARNGHQAIIESHNWSQTAQTLVRMYDQLVEALGLAYVPKRDNN